MGHNKNTNSNVQNRGWKANSEDGNLLAKLLKQKKLSAGVAPAAIEEACPQFKWHKDDSFAIHGSASHEDQVITQSEALKLHAAMHIATHSVMQPTQRSSAP